MSNRNLSKASTEAIILAAGQGKRLQESGHTGPKGMLKIGNRSIIEESIIKLLKIGVSQVTIVVGYRSEVFSSLAKKYREVTFVDNPEFASTGSMASFLVGLADIDSDCFLLDSDIVYEERALRALKSESSKDAILASGETNSGDEVWVSSESGRLTGFSKNPENLVSIVGEFVGICKFSRELLESVKSIVEEDPDRYRGLEYEGFLDEISADFPISVCLVSNLLWGEIDNLEHLERVRNEVYPAIGRRDSTD